MSKKEAVMTSVVIFNLLYNTLFEKLPNQYENDIDVKTHLRYEHLRHQYFEGGISIYGQS